MAGTFVRRDGRSQTEDRLRLGLEHPELARQQRDECVPLVAIHLLQVPRFCLHHDITIVRGRCRERCIRYRRAVRCPQRLWPWQHPPLTLLVCAGVGSEAFRGLPVLMRLGVCIR